WAVGIFGGKKSAFLRGHVAADVIENVAGDCFILPISRDLVSVEIRDGELRLVIKHFFKVRHVPVTIDGVAVKATADVIVHAAGGHFAQGESRHFERLFASITLGIASVEPRKEIQRDGTRKFRGVTESAFLWIVTAIELLVSGVQNFSI